MEKIKTLVESSLSEASVVLSRLGSKSGLAAAAKKVKAAVKAKIDVTDDEVSPDGPFFSVEIDGKDYMVVVLDEQSFNLAFPKD